MPRRFPLRTVHRAALLVCVLAVLAACTPSEGPADARAGYPLHPENRPVRAGVHGPVWLIAVDGATWTVIRPLADAGRLPTLARWTAEGAWGVLQSEEPTISPALWATVATGVPRDVHGVVNFVERVPGTYDARSVGPAQRAAPALWERVGAAGGRAAVISWFGSFPAEAIEGHYVSKGFDPERPRDGQVHPPELVERLTGATVRLRRGDVERLALTPFLQDALVDDARTMAVLREVVALERHDLVVAYLALPDIVQHVTWGEFDPTTREFPAEGPADPRLAGVIPAAYEFIDASLAEIETLAPPEATIVLVSDHGAGPMGFAEAYHLQLEVLLETLGLMDEGRGTAFAISELYRDRKRIWLNERGVDPQGVVAPDDVVAETRRLAARLGALTTADGDPVFAEIRDLTADRAPGEPVLEVRFSGEALLAETILDGDDRHAFAPVRLRHGDVSGSHRNEGIVVLRGPGVRPGRLETTTLYDIAPTVLHLLGLPQDEAMLMAARGAGRVIQGALAPSWLSDHPVTMVPGTELALQRRLVDAPEDPEDDERLERLRGLGYIR